MSKEERLQISSRIQNSMVRNAAGCGGFCSLTYDRSDNDMYGRRKPGFQYIASVDSLDRSYEQQHILFPVSTHRVCISVQADAR